ncbi:MAG: hypothetical protein GX276_05600 [Clostridiaceae bacterium]|nr:hypothetical protein [Clostridiaceae bacterium]
MDRIGKVTRKIMQTIQKIAAGVKPWFKRLGRRISSQILRLYRNAKIRLMRLRAWYHDKSSSKPNKSEIAAKSRPRQSGRISPPTDPFNQTTARIVLRKLPKSKPIRRRSRERVYRLKGYTKVAKVNRKYQSERQQNVLRRLLFFVIIVLVIILLVKLYNPIQDLSEWYRILGIQGLDDLVGGPKTTTTTQIPTVSSR